MCFLLRFLTPGHRGDSKSGFPVHVCHRVPSPAPPALKLSFRCGRLCPKGRWTATTSFGTDFRWRRRRKARSHYIAGALPSTVPVSFGRSSQDLQGLTRPTLVESEKLKLDRSDPERLPSRSHHIQYAHCITPSRSCARYITL